MPNPKRKIIRLSQEKFVEVFGYVPRVAINMFILNDKDEFLLTKRNIEPNIGVWHLPGSFLLKNEQIDECIRRVFKNELGVSVENYKAKLLGAFENLDGDPRGHIVDLVYGMVLKNVADLSPTSQSKEIKFFKDIPKNIGFNQDRILKQISF